MGRLRVRRGSLLCLHPRLPFSESSAGPPITSLRPGGVYCTKGPGRWLPQRETNVRCKAPHLIKIILAYSPKKKRADPIEDESEVQQGHFRPPSHGAVRGRYRSYSSQPASSGISNGSVDESTSNRGGFSFQVSENEEKQHPGEPKKAEQAKQCMAS